MITPTLKLNIAHKQIILIFSGAVVQRTGELTEGWERDNHIQHTADVLKVRIDNLRKQFNNTDLTNEDRDQIKSFEKMIERDLKNMVFNIQNDKLPKELIDDAKKYLNDMKEVITVLKAVIG